MGLVMKNKFPLIGVMLLALPTALFADIVYQGKRVAEWPEEARPTFDNSRGLLKAVATQEKSHYAAPKGKIYSLTLLVDFTDKVAPVTVNEVEDWLNKEGFNRDGCNGSVRDYYLDVSNGQLDLTNEVYSWYRAKHPKSWYEGLQGYSGSDSLMKEVFDYFDPQVDFSRYDNDKDGTTEAINIVYAGSMGSGPVAAFRMVIGKAGWRQADAPPDDGHAGHIFDIRLCTRKRAYDLRLARPLLVRGLLHHGQ